MPFTQEQENYFKLLALVYCFGSKVLCELLYNFLQSTNTTFETFINDHQHEIYHFFCIDECCQCKTNPIMQKHKFVKVINKTQMQNMFESSNTDRLQMHYQQKGNSLCCLKANKSVKLKDLDLTLIKFFLVHFCYKVFWDCHLKNENKSFSAFLEENVHKVYHLSVNKICCCMCNVDRDIPDRCILREKQFEIVCKKGRSPCSNQFCSCQYTVQSDLTVPSLADADADLTTKLTMLFCSCRKSLENIYEIRNKLAHHPNISINTDTFLKIWKETKQNILEIAKALNMEKEYEEDLKQLIDGPTKKGIFITVLLNLLKTSEHVKVNALKKIEGKADSIQNKIEEVYTLVDDIQIDRCNNINSHDCSGLSIITSLKDIAIALCKENTSEGNPDNFQEKEVSFELKIQINPTSNQLVQAREDENSDPDDPDSFICGKCKENFTKLKLFCKHKETCKTKQVKPAKQYLEVRGTFIISEASDRCEDKVIKRFQDNPDQFDVDSIIVQNVERGCLIVWTESTQYDLENEDKLKEDCIQFTKKMFQKCPLDSSEATTVKVNVKFSKMFEDSLETKDDDSDYLQCGTCRQEFITINHFIAHKKDCIRSRKRIKRNQEDISKLPLSSEKSSGTIFRTESDSTNRSISSQLPQSSEEPPETISRTESDSTNQSISSQLPQSSEKPPETISGTESDSTNQSISSQVCFKCQGGLRPFSNEYEESTRICRLKGFSKEEFNFAKIAMIVLNILCDALYDLLKQDKSDLRPRSECDLVYLYSEHRLINKHTPSTGWGGMMKDIPFTDIAIGDDVKRIRLARIEITHARKFELDEKRYIELCTMIVDLLKRFNQHNKPTRLYTDHLNTIFTNTIHEEEVKAVTRQIENVNNKVCLKCQGGLRQLSNVYEEYTRICSLKGFTKEEINCAKMWMIVLNILTDVLYDLLKQDRAIHRPRSDCDISYLYSEHRKLNKHIPSNSSHRSFGPWGGTWLDIQNTDIAIGDDIERIRLARSEITHAWKYELNDKRYNDLCTIIEDLLKRFDQHNKPTRLYTDYFYEILSKTINDEEEKGVMHKVVHEIESGRVRSSMQQSLIASKESRETSSLTGFTKEEINCAKMWIIVQNVLTDVLYDLLKQDKAINRPRSECEITYLYSEHRKLNKHIPSNSSHRRFGSWGGTWLDIQNTDIAIGDDIERIRLTRNELQHSKMFKLDEKRYTDLCTIIVDLLKRFDQHNKPARLYTNQLNEIFTKTIHEDEVKVVMLQIEENTQPEMTYEVEKGQQVNVGPPQRRQLQNEGEMSKNRCTVS